MSVGVVGPEMGGGRRGDGGVDDEAVEVGDGGSGRFAACSRSWSLQSRMRCCWCSGVDDAENGPGPAPTSATGGSGEAAFGGGDDAAQPGGALWCCKLLLLLPLPLLDPLWVLTVLLPVAAFLSMPPSSSLSSSAFCPPPLLLCPRTSRSTKEGRALSRGRNPNCMYTGSRLSDVWSFSLQVQLRRRTSVVQVGRTEVKDLAKLVRAKQEPSRELGLRWIAMNA